MEAVKRIHALLEDEAGVTAIEYALFGALIAMAIVTSVSALGVNLSGLYKAVADKVQDAAKGT
jgi:pilus assembly protein Flp/PilA